MFMNRLWEVGWCQLSVQATLETKAATTMVHKKNKMKLVYNVWYVILQTIHMKTLEAPFFLM